jgi:hypothetical protein
MSVGQAVAQGATAHPSPPPRPFDLRIPNSSAPIPATPRPEASGAGTQAGEQTPRSVSNAPAPPRRPEIAPQSNPADEEEEDEAPAWPRRTPGQRDLQFDPRPEPEDTVIASGISTDPGTSTRCLPQPLQRVLQAVVRQYGAVRVTSTWRPAFRARRHSYHRRCQAVDFRVPGQSPRAVLSFVKTLPETGGHKVYWNGLVHVDTGPWRSW